MKNKPVTIEALKELNPSLENPVEIIEEGDYMIKVVLIHKDSLSYLNPSGSLHVMNKKHLTDFYFPPKKREIITLTDYLDDFGNVRRLTLNKEFFNSTLKKVFDVKGNLIKLGTEEIDIDKETLEVVAVRRMGK